MSGKEFSVSFHVASYDCDLNRQMKIGAVLRYMQELSEMQLSRHNLNYERCYQMDMAFIATKIHVQMYAPLHLGQPFVMTTWHRGVKGAQFFRDYAIEDGQGNLIGEATSCWALIQISSGKILRPSEGPALEEVTNPDRAAATAAVPRLRLPQAFEEAERRVVRYSDLDYNQHLNNTVYADIVCDIVPGLLKGKRVSRFVISYLAENREGETLRLFHGQKDDDHYFWGNNTKGRSFEALLHVTNL